MRKIEGSKGDGAYQIASFPEWGLGGAHSESFEAGMLFNLIVSLLSGQSAWSI